VEVSALPGPARGRSTLHGGSDRWQRAEVPSIVIPGNCAGPPGIGHGGYVAGLLARRVDGPVQVTLRRPAPLEVELELGEAGPGRWCLRLDGEVLAEAAPGRVELSVPPTPSVEEARAAEAGSPSRRHVHPICLGCGLQRDDDEGLAITVGPLTAGGAAQVAAVWRPTDRHRLHGSAAASELPGGEVDPLWVLAALDCPGAMAFIAEGLPAGLLGRISFEQLAPVPVGVDAVVTGWQVGREGRKMFAGTALSDPEGRVLARAAATWFSMG
jgi:hypothetical protein